tara:strand:- start:302 stop:529 length:228 start_codon:yes stop_codon:yes gene_type:complete
MTNLYLISEDVIMKNNEIEKSLNDYVKENAEQNADKLFDKNCEVLSDDFYEISEENFYLADALAQDGLDVEDFAI